MTLLEDTYAPAVAPAVPATETPFDAALAQIRDGSLSDYTGDVLSALIEAGSHDVHLTMSSGKAGTRQMRVQVRFEGEIHDVVTYDAEASARLFGSVKNQAALGSQADSPNSVSGSLRFTHNGREVRARAERLPLVDGGEKVNLRLPESRPLRSIDELSFTTINRAQVDACLRMPRGLFLVAGPMNEGKSSTAQTLLLDTLNRIGGIAVSVEDPPERILPGVDQIPVVDTGDAAATYAHHLEHIVRSDADVIYIGEIRNAATARIAQQLSEAGRLVISTIHANDGLTAMRRMLELSEAPPLATLSSIIGVLSQRLVRKVASRDAGRRYVGRQPIHEVLVNNDQLVDAMVEGTSASVLRQMTAAASTSFDQNLQELIRAGVTDQDQAVRTIGREVAL
ncbi:ATPase, T2SS/T4P/T4SS family [uncultured Leifsonia sp.]|uniref:ATPase, T2SS/T4P/T4SS family n=1 Tax=uncultured Leifsonia sp. TaxID=340359 RepID=UPI0025E8E424|nr:ATPase, T2SS/T4P/T4SS family [uncultured Leifsonia sp.]